MKKLKLGILISGRGSNLQALINACSENNYPAEIVLVISNKPDAQGLKHAIEANIETQVIEHNNYSDRESFDKDLNATLYTSGVELICLAGFMRLLSGWFIEEWPNKIINIHPSLLPAFKGTNSQAEAIASGVKISGCTVHFVTKDMDAGPIIMQAAVPVLPDDDKNSLAQRILISEHKCYSHVIRLIALNKIKVKNKLTIDISSKNIGELIYNPSLE